MLLLLNSEAKKLGLPCLLVSYMPLGDYIFEQQKSTSFRCFHHWTRGEKQKLSVRRTFEIVTQRTRFHKLCPCTVQQTNMSALLDATNGPPQSLVGTRIRDDNDFRGTIRYVGPVATSTKDPNATWYGVEWDDNTRGASPASRGAAVP